VGNIGYKYKPVWGRSIGGRYVRHREIKTVNVQRGRQDRELVANKEWMRGSAGWWYGGMVAREGFDVVQLHYISSCVLVREEGVNGLLGIV